MVTASNSTSGSSPRLQRVLDSSRTLAGLAARWETPRPERETTPMMWSTQPAPRASTRVPVAGRISLVERLAGYPLVARLKGG